MPVPGHFTQRTQSLGCTYLPRVRVARFTKWKYRVPSKIQIADNQ